MPREFVIYTGDDCTFCKMAKVLIKANGDTYIEKNVSEDEEARKEFLAMGYRGVPVVFLDGEEFAHGYPILVQKIGR